jgi:thiol-disulfide isomerase/thioredoxin
MKKIILVLSALVLFIHSGIAQGIIFEHSDWENVQAKAKQENKIIFIDFYTSWCGPCKVLSKNVFPQKEVGDFYNKNFINYKIDAEKGEGPFLAEKYGVQAYPTLLFTDANGKFLHKGVGGMGAESLIELGKAALDPNKQLGKFLEENKQVNKAEMPAYLRKLSRERLPYKDKYEAYIGSLTKKELLTRSTFYLMANLGGVSTESFTFDLIYKNKQEYAKLLGNKVINKYFFDRYLSKVYEVERMEQAIEPVYEEIENKGFGFANQIKERVELTGLNYKGKYDEFIEKSPIYVQKYGPDDKELLYEVVFFEAVKFFHKSPATRAYALKLSKELIESNCKVDKVYSKLAKKYFESGELHKALAYYQKASNYFKEKGKTDKAAKIIGTLKKKIDILEQGKFEYKITGLNDYDGCELKILHRSEKEIGELVDLGRFPIQEGTCIVKGKLQSVGVPAIWSIHKGEEFRTKGKLILEPGTYKAKKVGRSIEVNDGYYNHIMYKGLEDSPILKKISESANNLAKSKEGKILPQHRAKQNTLWRQRSDVEYEYYRYLYENHPNHEIKILAFYVGRLRFKDKDGTEVEKLNKKYADHWLVKTIVHDKEGSERRARMRNSVSVGKTIKPFTAKNLEGKEFKLEDAFKQNKYILLEFWASWCGPCRGVIPHLKKLYKKYNPEGFEIVSFSLDHKEKMWHKASVEEQIKWVNVSDVLGMKSPIVKMYGVSSIPYSLLVNNEGKVIATFIGSENIDEKLEEVFSK